MRSCVTTVVVLPLLFAGFMWTSARSQNLHWNVNIDQTYSTNPFRSLEPEATWISSAVVDFSSQIGAVQAGYTGNISGFHRSPGRNFYRHGARLTYSDTSRYVGLEIAQRINHDEYFYYNYTAAVLFLAMPGDFPMGNLHYSGNLAWYEYPGLEEYKNIQAELSVQWNYTLPSRTTIITGAGMNYKQYLNNAVRQTAEPGLSNDFAPYTAQINWRLRFAQGITAGTGLAVQYQYRHFFSSGNYTTTDLLYWLAQESAVFDDHISYQGASAGVELTQLLTGNIIGKMAGYRFMKRYPDQPPFIDQDTYETNLRREDRFSTFWITLERMLPPVITPQSRLSVQLMFQWMSNQSNSYWYKYEARYASVGIVYSL